MGSASGIRALLAVMAVGVFPPEAQSVRPPEHFVYQARLECGFPDGTGPGVRYLERHFWGRQEILRFDSRRGTFEAVTALGQPVARDWNRDNAFLEQKRADVDIFCRHNYGIFEPFAGGRKQHFVYQSRAECGFPDGTGPGVHYLERHFWGWQEIVRFDSRRGSFEAVTELGQAFARQFNSDKAFLEQARANVDIFCRHNYGIFEPFARQEA